MKIILHTLTTDNDAGLNTEVFTTDEERDAAAWEWLAESKGVDVEFLRTKYENDLGEAYSNHGGGACHLDSMNWDDVEIEVPDPAPPPVLVAPITAFCEAFGNALHREDEINGGDAVDELAQMWPSFHAAQKYLDNLADPPAPVSAETAGDDDDAGEDDDEDSPFNQNRFTNYYECSNCGTEWTDNWSCECNDRCPKCNREIEPYKSEENEED